MKQLGFIPFPERFSPVGENCVLADSTEAFDFFENYYGNNGVVVLGRVSLNWLQQPHHLGY